jgi:hypothetical protein
VSREGQRPRTGFSEKTAHPEKCDAYGGTRIKWANFHRLLRFNVQLVYEQDDGAFRFLYFQGSFLLALEHHDPILFC